MSSQKIVNPSNPLGSPSGHPMSDKITHVGLARRLSQLLLSTNSETKTNDLSNVEQESVH